ERDPAVRRRAHGQRVEKEAELRTLLLGRDLQQVEHARLHLGLVDSNRAAADLVAVRDEVVSDRRRPSWILVEALLPVGCGPSERMVASGPTLLSLVPLEHREAFDPHEVEPALVDTT